MLRQKLWDDCDSDLERSWLTLLEDHGFIPPTHGQYLISESDTRPDFFYEQHRTAIYIDGPPHDTPDAKAYDKEIESKLIRAGYAFIRFHHEEDWLEKLRAHGDVFGPGRDPS